jgi:hypothetical protein
MADVWDWVEQSLDSFIEQRDRPRYEMHKLFRAGIECIQHAPDKALFFLGAARTAAEQLEEPWWVILCDHWTCQVLLEHSRNISAAAELSNKLIEQTTGNADYEGLPQLVCLHDDRAGAMLSIDPLGYAEQIEADCHVIDTKGKSQSSCLHCSRGTRIGAHLCSNNLESAESAALEGLKLCNADHASFYLPIYYCALCVVAARRQDWVKLAQWATPGSLFFGKMGTEGANIELLMWLAVGLLKTKGQEKGRDAYRKARKAGKAAGKRLPKGYFDALAIYHEENGQPKLALAARTMQLDNTSGAPYLECQTRLERVRLLKSCGLPVESEIEKLKLASALLRDPSQIYERLAEI